MTGYPPPARPAGGQRALWTIAAVGTALLVVIGVAALVVYRERTTGDPPARSAPSSSGFCPKVDPAPLAALGLVESPGKQRTTETRETGKETTNACIIDLRDDTGAATADTLMVEVSVAREEKDARAAYDSERDFSGADDTVSDVALGDRAFIRYIRVRVRDGDSPEVVKLRSVQVHALDGDRRLDVTLEGPSAPGWGEGPARDVVVAIARHTLDLVTR